MRELTNRVSRISLLLSLLLCIPFLAYGEDFDYVYLKDGNMIAGTIIGLNHGMCKIPEKPKEWAPALLVLIDQSGRGDNSISNFRNIASVDISNIRHITFVEGHPEGETEAESVSRNAFAVYLKDGTRILTSAPFLRVQRRKNKTFFHFLKEKGNKKIEKGNLARMHFPALFTYDAKAKGGERKYTFKIAKASSQLAAVEKLEDQAVLAEIAENDENEDVRKAAIMKLIDQTILSRIAKNDKKYSVREAATKHPNLVDQTVLVHIAQHDKNWEVRREATKKLTAQPVLAEIAKNDDNEDVREAAVENLEDQAVIAEIAENDDNKDVRKAAIESLEDQSIIAKIAKNDKNEYVRRKAVARMTDQTLLTSVANSDGNKWVRNDAKTRHKAINKIKKLMGDCDTGNSKSCWKLVEMAGDDHWLVRKTLFELVTDQTLLTEIANKSGSFESRLTAVKKLTDKTILNRIAENDKNPNVRMAAKKRLKKRRNQEL